MIDRLEQDLSSIRSALGARGYRQELLASNIANADTPHYKARDIDFKAALSTAQGTRSAGSVAPVTLARTQAGHLGGGDESPFGGAARYRSEYQGAVDGNTVNMDVERAAFAENALQVEALITFINGRFRTMQTAIQGQ
jgi:flagellar basal-body rod protein FlgB